MVNFFKTSEDQIIAVKSSNRLADNDIDALKWLFSGAEMLKESELKGFFVGPRREMLTPWSTNATEITRNMNIAGIERIEEFTPVPSDKVEFDRMLLRLYDGIGQDIFTVGKQPEPIVHITDFVEYNRKEGLALSDDEIKYLENLSAKLGRSLTDSEVFGFSQVNSEHCRHKIFNGTFVIDGIAKPSSLFKLIKKTSESNPNHIVSAYKDNCAFIDGPLVNLFHPLSADKPDFFTLSKADTVISLKAETHNFPTTVEPFNGAATGSGGEIRDRIAGGKGSFPIAGTAVYMTSYPRFDREDTDTVLPNVPERDWEKTPCRRWLYQSPQEILIKASNGASDFGNKFGQPVICGSLLTYEHEEDKCKYGYDKVIMMAGGVGYALRKDSLKETPHSGDAVVLLGGDNYRIGMGGGAVSSVATGEYANAIELNAVQRSNPEMQKRAYNAIRAVSEKDGNPIISVHDHGAGGHLNCLSELVEDTGGVIDISKLPIGDPTLSDKEIIGNESQERMGLVIKSKDVDELRRIASRERAPFYEIGVTTDNHQFTLKNGTTGEVPIDLKIEDMLGTTPKTVMEGHTVERKYARVDGTLRMNSIQMEKTIEKILQLEAVACKDWLTNKVDRSVTGLIACQQSCGEIQLPLNDVAVTAVGYEDKEGIATSVGHAPSVGLIDPEAGSRISIAEALTNIVWAPLCDGLRGVSLSANWMWPTRNDGEDARLYSAVKAASDFAIELGINIPTGKDSMSMTQKYPDGSKVLAPGTLIISTVAQVSDVNKVVHTAFVPKRSDVIYIPFTKETSSPLGGSAYAQVSGRLGDKTVDVKDPDYFAKCFNTLQRLISQDLVLAGHDISAGGLVTALLEVNFPNTQGGLYIDLSYDSSDLLFCEKPGVIIQVNSGNAIHLLKESGILFYEIGEWQQERRLDIRLDHCELSLDIDRLRDVWFKSSYLLDRLQSGSECAYERFQNYKHQPLKYKFPIQYGGMVDRQKETVAAIIREQGSNGDREMAWALYKAGFKVKDVHMTDLIEGREDLKDVKLIVFVGGFSNSDTLGSAKGWAGAFLYNQRAKKAIEDFYNRRDTMSLGVCNGCQLMGELGFITPEDRDNSPKLRHNESHKFESCFVGVNFPQSPSIMLKPLVGSSLGVWVAHGEGKFTFPKPLSEYNVAMRYNYNEFPANPNGSPEGVAAVCSADGRHLAMMPHPERCIRPWNWPLYPSSRKNDSVTPWIECFKAAKAWCDEH